MRGDAQGKGNSPEKADTRAQRRILLASTATSLSKNDTSEYEQREDLMSETKHENPEGVLTSVTSTRNAVGKPITTRVKLKAERGP